MIKDQVDLGLDCGDKRVLDCYESMRGRDSLALLAATHGLNWLFGQENPFIIGLRQLGMRAVGDMPSLRHAFMDYAMGMVRI